MIKNKAPLISKKKSILIGVVLALLLVSGATLYSVKNNRRSAQIRSDDQTQQDINYDPPTEEEKKQAEDNKSRLAEEQDQPQPSANNKASVKPEITIAEVSGQFVELGGYVPGMFENNGNCVVTFARKTHIITRQVQSEAEGRATYCPLIKVPVNEFPEKGTWQVKITYDSTVYSGSSSERSVEVK